MKELVQWNCGHVEPVDGPFIIETEPYDAQDSIGWNPKEFCHTCRDLSVPPTVDEAYMLNFFRDHYIKLWNSNDDSVRGSKDAEDALVFYVRGLCTRLGL